MWTRLFPSALPTPLRSGDVRRKTIREQLLDEDEDDAHPPLPKKRAHYSMHPIFEKYKRRKINDDDLSIDRLRGRRQPRTSLSPIPESPILENLKRRFSFCLIAVLIIDVVQLVPIVVSLSRQLSEVDGGTSAINIP
jgi:hypothetical protein